MNLPTARKRAEVHSPCRYAKPPETSPTQRYEVALTSNAESRTALEIVSAMSLFIVIDTCDGDEGNCCIGPTPVR